MRQPDLFEPDPIAARIERMEVLFKRIEDSTVIPDDKVDDVEFLRVAVSLANLWAGAGPLDASPTRSGTRNER